MSPAAWSLVAFVIAVGLSCTSRINAGIVALGLAWAVGSWAAALKPEAIASGFPSTLFLTLVGVTLLFALAEANGTLDVLARRALARLRDPRWVPAALFVLAAALSGAGPGAVPATALTAPVAMAVGLRSGASAFLIALMVANGANAGNLSPLSAVGIIARDGMAKAGLTGVETKVFLANFVAHAIVALAAWLWLRPKATPLLPADAAEVPSLTRPQMWTGSVILLWILSALVLNVPVGFSAFVAAGVLILSNAADEPSAWRRMPWPVIVMVCGMTTLVAVLEKTGGLALVTSLLAALASPMTVNGVAAFVTGLISTWSSTSGVVMPAFLPTVGSLAGEVGGGDPLAIALSINVGSSLVDVSPLSTIGALCVAAVADPAASRTLFRQLLIWGLSMVLVGALLAQTFAGFLARV